ncbi:MAG: transposase [Deltaproteobacteria bacterium]|nr:transposase [Deltaproteobacteria bacterium]
MARTKPGHHQRNWSPLSWAFFEGFSLHCCVRQHENEREVIERLCRYGARGPLTLGGLSRDGGDVYRYRMKRSVRGRDELVMTGNVAAAGQVAHLVKVCSCLLSMSTVRCAPLATRPWHGCCE